jgi:hypothetical protein
MPAPRLCCRALSLRNGSMLDDPATGILTITGKVIE